MDFTKKKKIFNDPVYGFINFPHSFLYELIDHPFVQRMRRIKQLGLTDYVYSGASHSRFNHSLGALHLMTQAIQSLRWKGVEISDEESEAVCIAILLHDVGHGPFSHALEKLILPFSHEEISCQVMKLLNDEYDGKLNMAMEIFSGQYDKVFLHQLVASQLDMDRMDYLNRDSFYTGVVEGMIGYDRIIKMLNVVDGKLVVEEKGSLSVEQFLMARRIMYWQVYLHKTVLAVEKMLANIFAYLHRFVTDDLIELMPASLQWFFLKSMEEEKINWRETEVLPRFLDLDDSDILVFLKRMAKNDTGVVGILSKGIIERRLFKIILKNEEFSREYLDSVRHNIANRLGKELQGLEHLLITGSESNAAYNQHINEIQLLMKDGRVYEFTNQKDLIISTKKMEKYFLICPAFAIENNLLK